jgi:phospholipid/cholesterol/gamma-HCH transport system substrate-binding protein
MMTHEQQMRLSIFIVVATAVLLGVVALFVVPKILQRGATYSINFVNTSVYGLTVGSTVTYQGLDIGKVTKMEANPKALDSVLVHIQVPRNFPIMKDTTAVLMYAGITGLKFIDLKNGTKKAGRLPPGSEIRTGEGLEEIAGNIVNNVQSAISRVNSLLSDKNREQITGLLEQLERSARTVASILESKRPEIDRTLDNAAKASGDISAATADLRAASSDLRGLVAKVKPPVEAAAEDASRILSDLRAHNTVGDLSALIAKTRDTLDGIDRLFRSNDSELARALRGFQKSMDDLSQLVREILEDPTILFRTRKEKRR